MVKLCQAQRWCQPLRSVLWVSVSTAEVSWLVGLSHPLENHYESDSFAIGDSEPVLDLSWTMLPLESRSVKATIRIH